MATAYPFDPSGTSSANRIANEQHVITAQNFRDYHYVIPNFAPFFEADLKIRLQYPDKTFRTLVYGVDYYLSNQFLDASRACAKALYGSISFLDTDTAGILSLSYNTVGGVWNITPAEITRILAEEMRNPRITTWEQITYLPSRFPTIDHEWDLIDMVGATKVVDAIEQVRAAILSANGGGITDHVNNYSNPHNTTKAQVGLGSVENFPVATVQQAQEGTSNSFYMTPLRTADAIAAAGGALFNTHTSNNNNPHNTTKAQVGLGSVQNYSTATQAQAEAGSQDNLYMTPLKTAQAIAALAGNGFAAHVASQQNPHNVTKDQVGLFNVSNYPVATQQESRDGTANDRYMTPLRTKQLVSEFVTTQLDGHATRTDNPHNTTKEQVGLSNVENYPIATEAQAMVGDSNATYMTPGRTADAIDAQAAPKAHLNDMANPHQVTKSQVGLASVENYPIATQQQAKDGVVNDKYMTPLRTKDLVTEFVKVQLDGHATRTDNPHATTADQVGLGNVLNYAIATQAEAEAGQVANKYMTPQRTTQLMGSTVSTLLAKHTSLTNNPHSVTAAQVGAYTRVEVDSLVGAYVRLTDEWVAGKTKTAFIAEVLTGTAANATKFSGKTYDEVMAAFKQTISDSLTDPLQLRILALETNLTARVKALEDLINSVTVA